MKPLLFFKNYNKIFTGLNNVCYLWFVLLSIISISGYAQINEPTSIPFQEVPNSRFQIHGELKMIGNNIVAPSESNEGNPMDPNTSYNGDAESGQFNAFGYIDVDGYIDEDGDGTDDTFSSSSAAFYRDSECGKIVYAGLYWSAAYIDMDNVIDLDGDRGIVANYANPTFPDPRPAFNTIKVKPPAGTYIDIPSEEVRILYDGYPDNPDTPINENPYNPNSIPSNRPNNAVVDMPYHCYADITKYIKDLENPDGTYTIANQRAAVGRLESNPDGGFNRSDLYGGWTLVIVYEDPGLPLKEISTYDGVAIVSGSTGDLNYSLDAIKTVPAPSPTKIRYGISGMGGAKPLTNDRILLEATNGEYVALSTPPIESFPNAINNFFDSSISVDGIITTDRNPASSNTLGYDIDIFDLTDGIGNELIGNDQTQMNFKLTTSGDKHHVFLNTVETDIIDLKLRVLKRVFDENGMDITGGDVNFGDRIFYELEIQNIGDEDITAASITDILPANTELINGSINFDPGVNVAFDGNSTLNISIEDAVVELSDPPVKITFGVQIATDCSNLLDECSNEIINIATSTYTGVTSGVQKIKEESISEFDSCGFEVVGTTNFLILDGVCIADEISALLCRGQVNLVAGNGFDTYEWKIEGTTTVLSTEQVLTAYAPGRYTVRATRADCMNKQQTFVVGDEPIIENNIVDIVGTLDSNPNANGNIRVCPDTGEELPEIFLCGIDSTLDLDAGYDAGAVEMIWQRLDPTSCSTFVRDVNCPTVETDCEPFWTTVGTGRILRVGEADTPAGEYRISIDVSGDCSQFVYFNLFKNNLTPELKVVQNIICGASGSIEVINASDEYEYQLEFPDGSLLAYGMTTLYTGLTQPGTYQVYARNINAQEDACEFVSTEVLLESIDPTVTIVNIIEPACEEATGSFSILIENGVPEYRYIVSGPDGYTRTITGSEDTTMDFTGLLVGSYQWEVYSDDDNMATECFESGSILIDQGEPFAVNVMPTAQIGCNPNYQPDPSLNDETVPNYDPTAPPYDPELYIAVVEVEVVSSSISDNYTFSSVPDFSTTIDDFTSVNGIYNVRFTTPGTKTIYVRDNATGCMAQGATNVIELVPTLATAASNNPTCFNDTASIEVQIVSGIGPFDFVLDGLLSEAGTDAVLTAPGNFTFNNIDPTTTPVIHIIDGLGCETTVTYDPIEISDPIQADITLIKPLSCSISSPDAKIQVSNISGGSGNYEWSLNVSENYENISGNSFDVDFSTSGNYSMYIRDITDLCVESFEVVIDPIIEFNEVSVNATNVTCFGGMDGTIEVIVAGGIPPFLYALSNETVPNPIYTQGDDSRRKLFVDVIPGTYDVLIKDINDCIFSTPVIISEPPPIEFEVLTTPDSGNRDGVIEIATQESALLEYRLELPDETVLSSSSDPIFLNLVTGDYVVVVIDANGCEQSQQVKIESSEQNPLLNYADEILFCALTGQSYPVIVIEDQSGTELEISLSGIASIVWQKLDEINCDLELEDSCPTEDSSCSSDWFTLCTTPNCMITNPGEYRIVIDFNNKSSNSTQTYYFRAMKVLGNQELSTIDFKMYPNPAKDAVHITSINQSIDSVEVMDLTGKVLIQTENTNFNISNLNKGVYFVMVRSKDQESMLKLIKK